MRAFFLLGLILQMAVVGFASADTRVDTEFVSAVAVLETCPVTLASDVKGEGTARSGESLGLIGGTLVAGLAGDLVTAGLNALGSALEEASREKGFSAIGNSSFDFYAVQKEAVYTVEEITVKPDLAPDLFKCLVISYAAKPAFGAADPTVAAELKSQSLGPKSSDAWANAGLPQNPDVYVEAMLQPRRDGFVVRPAFVWYRHPFPKAPKKESPAELHTSFSIPSGPTGETAALFALARMRLPKVAPGAMVRAPALKAYASGVLPHRPTDGSPERTRAAFALALTNLETNLEEVRKATRAVDRAETAAAAPGATAETKAKVQPLKDFLEDAITKTKPLQDRWDAMSAGPSPIYNGSTNVGARFTVVRDANKFGMAIAAALKGRAAATGQAITTELTPAAPKPAWSAVDTGYVTAMTAVALAQRALDTALAGTDADAIFAAEIALKNAKANANAAAAASDRALPFPGII